MNSSVPSFDNVTEMAVAILRATHDGDDLAPSDLSLVELAVNDMLNADGKAAFGELHQNTTKPDGYTYPYLFGIEHLTIEHERCIRWKGVPVEHFDHSVWKQHGWQDDMRSDAEEVAAYCRDLEAKGITPTFAAVLERP